MSSVALVRSSPRGRRLVAAPVAWLVMLALVVLAPSAPAAAAVGQPTTYQDHAYASSAAAASADKPQSKLWFADGSWWAIMTTSASVNIFKLVGHSWVNTGTVVDPRVASTGDALWVPETNKLYIASRTASGTGAVRIFRFSYSPATDKYTRDSGFPVKIPGGGSESVTIARDTVGQLWITFTRGSRVLVAHSTASDTAWTAPFEINGADTAVSADDISAVVSLPGKTGVMWSDQASSAFRFAVHTDGAPDTAWTLETPLSGASIADDHINLKSLLGDDQGRVHAAVKTSLNDAGEPGSAPSIMVLSRTAAGTWTSAVTARLSDNLTRPQLALDRTNKLLFVLQSTEGGGTVYSKSTPLSSIAFGSGRGTPFMAWPGAQINDVSTTKDGVDAGTGLVAIASDKFASRYYHTEMSLGESAPLPPPGPAPGSTETVTLRAAGDSYVKATAPNRNYGGAANLDVDASPATSAYVKFDLSPYTGRTVASATLKVRATTSGSVGTQGVKLVGDDSWTESGLKYSNRPALGATVATLGPTKPNTSYDVPLDQVSVQSELGQPLSLGLDTTSSDGLDLGSRETSTPPVLVLVLEAP